MSTPPFRITIYDKAFVAKGEIGNPIRVECTPKFNAVGTLTVEVPSNHKKIDDILTPGARLVCDYRGEQVFSGPVRSISGEGPAMASRFTISCDSDIRLLWRMLGYPNPAVALADQDRPEDKRTGNAEAVLKAFLTANLGGPSRWPAHQLITIATNLNRGTSITATVAMQPLGDVLVPLVEQAGLGISVTQLPGNGAGLLVDVFEPDTYPRPLSEQGRTIRSWQWNRTAPGVTRAIVGGEMDDILLTRPWSRVINVDNTETDYSDVIELMVDGGSEEDEAERNKTGLAQARESGVKNGFTVELAETANFKYGGPGGVHVGDKLTVAIGTETITDILREARILWDRDTGFTATPTIGDLTDTNKTLAKYIANLARTVRALRK